MSLILHRAGPAAAAFAGLIAATPASCADVADFYRGKVLRIVVGYAAGGGFDVYARLLAENLPRYLPGNPSATLQYMPGAGSAVAGNYIIGVAPQDGTVIGIPNGALPVANYIRPGDGVDTPKMNWIGRLDATDSVGAVWHTTGVKTMEQLQARGAVFAAASQTGSSFTIPQALNRTLKSNIKLVMGYDGTTSAYLAMERGEVEGMGNAIWSQVKRTKKEWVSGKLINVLWRVPEEPIADLPGVPSAIDLVKTEDEKRVMRLLSSESTFGRSFYVGPGVPKERIESLRTAFDAMLKDPQFKASAEQFDTPINPLSGAALQKVIEDISSYPPNIFQLTRDLSSP